ncbi:MAG: hypothetical protein ACOYT9_02730 [Patescibacteria group bacterium]
MTYEEVNKAICGLINDALKYSSNGICKVTVYDIVGQEVNYHQADAFFRKLESKQKIKAIQFASENAWDGEDDIYTDVFEEYLFEVLDPSFLKGYENVLTTDQKGNQQREYFIKLENDRRILLNGNILMAKPDFNSENEVVFKYLYEHPNTTLMKDQIESDIKVPITKTFHKIVENLGFTSGFKQLFFDISAESIRFKNPVTVPNN